MRFRLLWHIFSVEVRKRMSYRADFWVNLFGSFAVTFSVFWFLTYAMFAATGRRSLGGFSPRSMLLYYLFAILMGRIVQSNELEGGISQDIYEGTLNRYLIYPVSYASVKFAEQAGSLAPQVIQLALFAAIVPVAVGIPEDIHITPATILMAAISLGIANLLHYLLILPIQAVAFWADNVWSLMIAERFIVSFLGGLMLPLDLFPGWARGVLRLLPFPYLYSVPIRALMGKAAVAEWAAGLGIALAWCAVAAFAGRAVWRRGDLQYTGVGI